MIYIFRAGSVKNQPRYFIIHDIYYYLQNRFQLIHLPACHICPLPFSIGIILYVHRWLQSSSVSHPHPIIKVQQKVSTIIMKELTECLKRNNNQ